MRERIFSRFASIFCTLIVGGAAWGLYVLAFTPQPAGHSSPNGSLEIRSDSLDLAHPSLTPSSAPSSARAENASSDGHSESPTESREAEIDEVTRANWQKLLNWSRKRDSLTVFVQGDDDGYSDFSHEQLWLMSRDGDMRAMRHLGDRAIKEGAEVEALQHYHMAAAHGSLGAVTRVINFYESKLDDALAKKDNGAALTSMIEISAWNEVLMQMGDPNGLYLNQPSWIKNEEYARVVERSSLIFQSLTRLRREMGLGEFDTRPPFADDVQEATFNQ